MSVRSAPRRAAGRPSAESSRNNFWGIALPRFFADPVWGTLVCGRHRCTSTRRGFDLKTIALTAWLPFVAADFGCMMGGTISAYLNKRFGIVIVDGKRVAFSLGAVLMIGMAGVGFVKDPAVAILLLCLGGFAHQTLSISVISLSADLFPKHEVATVTGMASFVAGIGNLGFTLMIGWLVSSIGYAPFFVALGCREPDWHGLAVDAGQAAWAGTGSRPAVHGQRLIDASHWPPDPGRACMPQSS